MRKLFIILFIFSLVGCGGGDSGGGGGSGSGGIQIGGGGGSGGGSSPSVTFWASDCRDSAPPFPEDMYPLEAKMVGEGDHCYIYLELNGRRAVEPDIPAIIYQFDNVIYPKLRAAYGNEPDQDINGDSKVYILLLDIKDDWNGLTIRGYVGGYFFNWDQFNEDHSNKKKILYMDIYPGNPNPSYSRFTDFRSFRHTLAHEFQHMIHWNKTGSTNINNTWLNEAMSELAPYYAFNETSASRISTFKDGTNHSNSLTQWGPNNKGNATVADYAVVYMWGQYMVDRFPADVFRSILNVSNKGRGKDSVQTYLSENYAGLDFASVFRDWSLAIFFGDGRASNPVSMFPDNAVWRYTRINTWATDVTSPFPFTPILFSSYGSFSNLQALDPWSLMYYQDNTLGSGSKSFSWNSTNPGIFASFWSGILTPTLSSPGSYPYSGTAYLILQNAQDTTANPNLSISPASDWIFYTQQETLQTPAEKLRAFSQSAAKESLLRQNIAGSIDGSQQESVIEPTPVCINDILSWRAEEIKRQMQESKDIH